jgi:two-component system, OmpR family, phosphate regulon sensor histidine kinase PhoR
MSPAALDEPRMDVHTDDPLVADLIAALPEPVLLVAQDGQVRAANQAAVELLGAQIRGAQIRGYLRQPEVAAMLDRALAGPVEATAQFVTSSAVTETVWQVTARPMRGGQMVLSFRDVSDREAAEAQRREFVANVSHELRSPLTVLAGFIETLQGSAAQDAAARQEFLAIMAREAERMTGLVADLLSLSRVEGAEKIRPRTPVALDMVLRATLAALRPQIEAAGIEVALTLPDDLPEVPGDYDQLVQVYHNLVENALKYGGSGGRIEIAARPLPPTPASRGRCCASTSPTTARGSTRPTSRA